MMRSVLTTDQARSGQIAQGSDAQPPDVAPQARTRRGGIRRMLWRADAAWRLGPRPLMLLAAHRLLARAPADIAAPAAPFLPGLVGESGLDHPAVLRAAAALPARFAWHGPFDAAAPAFGMDLFGPGDVRPVWEASRLAALPLLAQAARRAPASGHAARAGSLLADWCAANPPFRGPNWACGQEAALRALHLALALALLGADFAPPPGARALLSACAARIDATPLYAAAQDNNHAVSEPAGRFVIALLLADAPAARRAARVLAARLARLVAPDGGFAQVSPGYHRLLLDVLSLAEWFRARHGAPAFPAPFAARAAAATRWLHAVTDPGTGATPRLGLEDDSCLGDLSLCGPRDARGSLERAARLFCAQSAGRAEDPGCAWLGIPVPPGALVRPARFRASGTRIWREGPVLAVLRTGPLRFRPGQADLLHLTLMQGGQALIRDGGTGAYNPAAPWWWHAIHGACAHNAAVFDDREPMPRAGRFLLAGWPRLEDCEDGAAATDRFGNHQRRQVAVEGRVWTVTDTLRGPFRRAAFHWRLAPGRWELGEDGVVGEALAIRIAADAPFTLRLAAGWESPAYGSVRPAPVLMVRLAAPVGRVVTTLECPE
jgi:hypothetical protein